MTEFHEKPRTEQQHEQGPRRPSAADWEELLNGAARGSAPGRPGVPDLSQLFFFLDALRRMVPQELQDQFNALLREVLLTIRAMIDWYLERLERGPAEPQVEDIPID